MVPRLQDMAALIHGGIVDARITKLRRTMGAQGAFEAIYRRAAGDPWKAAQASNTFQVCKMDRIIDAIPADEPFSRALDLGCGNGVFTQELLRRAHEVVGVDLAASALAEARRRRGSPRIAYVQADALSLGAEHTQSYDLVCLIDVVYYLTPSGEESRTAMLIDAIARVLRPGGSLILANFHYRSWEATSALTQAFHDAFTSSPLFGSSSHRKFPFYLISRFERQDVGLAPGLPLG